MLRRQVLSTLVLAALMLAAGCAEPDVRRGMAALDEAYIPALTFTSEGDAEKSKAALAVLSAEWREFRNRFGGWRGPDKEWPADLGKVRAMIERATWLADANSPAEAYAALEPARWVMLALRQRNDIAYPLDYLTEFHRAMDTLVAVTSGRDPKSLTPAALDSLKADYALAASAWRRVESAGVDRVLYDFNEQELAEADAHIKAESQALGRLGEALAGSDEAAVLSAAAALKPEFMALYRMFGAFDRLR
jgi:hypothetical protein